MKTYRVTLTGVSEMFFGRPVLEPKLKNETHEQHDARTAPQKVYVEQIGERKGTVYIQPFALKNGLESAAKRIQRPIPGQGKSTYSKLFRQGVMCVEKIYLTDHAGKPLTLDDVKMLRIFVPSDGKRGSGKRVWRTFPQVTEWAAVGVIHIVDPKIDEEILTEHLVEFGQYIGMGSMRVENGGIAGRFAVESVDMV